MTTFDQRNQQVDTQYNAGRDINVYQPPLSLTEKQQKLNRSRMLQRVHAIWIEGVLEPSVQGTTQIALALQSKPSAVVTPLWHVLREFDTTGPLSSADASIVQVNDHANGELLILGEPGAGKTTLLLELTRALLERARQDESQPIPVVFPLSSWAMKRQPLSEWLTAELHDRYQVPLPLAASWIETDQVLPLLDGLDEVAAPHRAACVQAINTYRQAHGLLPTVVCSRKTDYLTLSTRLLLRTAVVVQPLTPEQIETYLTSGGEPLEALRQTLHEDVDLRELASTPLMLNVLMVAYQGTLHKEVTVTGSLETKQEQIFAVYVQRMLIRRSTVTRYTLEQTTHWLSSLANQMKRQSQTIFYLEQMQPTWLSGNGMLRGYDWLAVRLPGMLMGVLVLTISPFFVSIASIDLLTFIPVILLGGLLGWLLSEGSTPQRPTVSGRKARSVLGPRPFQWLLIGALFGLGNGLSIGELSNKLSFILNNGQIFGLSYGLTFGLSIGLSIVLSMGLCSILPQLLLRKNNTIEARSLTPSPARGTIWQRLIRRREVHNGLLVGLSFGLIIGLIIGLITGLGYGLGIGYGLSNGLSFGLITGLSFGLSTGLSAGLSFGLSTGVLSVLLIGRSAAVQPTDLLVWSWRSLGKSLFSKSHASTTVQITALSGLIIALSNGLSIGLGNGLSFGLSTGLSAGLSFGLSYGLSAGLSFGLSYWLLIGLFQGVSSATIEDQRRVVPNQGIRRSALNGLVLGLISTVLVGLIIELSYGLIIGLTNELVVVGLTIKLSNRLSLLLSAALLAGLSTGLLAGLLNGGLASFRHYVLRFLLWRTGSVPWHYVLFLDHAAEHILLRKVGGGYIFIHRLLLDYFASVETRSPEEASPVSASSDLTPAISGAPQIDTSHREEKASPTVPGRKTGFNMVNRIMTILSVVVLLVLAGSASIFSVVQHSMQNATATAQVEANDATAIALVKAETTAEALANASPITYPPEYKSPVLNDPLQDNSEGNGWEEDTSNGDCKFIHRAYDINVNFNGLEWCPSVVWDFTNFIFEVQMKIVKGDGEGIAFRIDPTNLSRFYYFTISQDGSYGVYIYNGSNYTLLTKGSSRAIHRGLGQTNLVAAVVHGPIIELYVNHKRVAVVINSIYTQGLIGVVVSGLTKPTEVIFQNAKVWTL